MTNKDVTNDKFYENFEYVISAVPTANKLIILGDFNARVGQDSASWKGVLVNTGLKMQQQSTASLNLHQA